MLCRTYYARLRGKVFFAKHFIILRNRYTNTNYTFFGWYVEWLSFRICANKVNFSYDNKRN
jgi:hypothetical protein